MRISAETRALYIFWENYSLERALENKTKNEIYLWIKGLEGIFYGSMTRFMVQLLLFQIQ